MTDPSRKTVAIIPSAGMGRRMGSRKKNYLALLGRPVLAHTIEAFERSASIDSIVVVVPSGDEPFCADEIVSKYGFKKVAAIVAGGAERQDSVRNGINAVPPGTSVIAVHDGARPLVTQDVIERVVEAARAHGAAIAAVPVKDTVKEASDGFVRRTVPREALLSVQTPQAFRAGVLDLAFKKALEDGFTGTDESSLVERTGVAVKAVEGSYENIKITTPEDMDFAECVLRKRNGAEKS